MDITTPSKLNLNRYLFIIFILLASTNFIQAVRISVRNCDGNLPVKLKDLTVSSGRIATATVTTEKIIEEGAHAQVTVKLGFIKLLDKEYDLCEEVKKLNNPQISCPISPGEYVVSHSLPQNIPRGKFVIDVRVSDVAGNEIGCVDLHADTRK